MRISLAGPVPLSAALSCSQISFAISSGVHCLAVFGTNVPGVFQSETSIEIRPPTSPAP